jgi:hypothetical protein
MVSCSAAIYLSESDHKGDRFGMDEFTGIGVGNWRSRLLSNKNGLVS